MKKLFIIAISILLMITLASCSVLTGAPAHEATTNDTSVSADPNSTKDNVVSIGKMVYIPINRNGLPEANIEIIFQAIDKWQKENPDKRILDVDYLYMQNGNPSLSINYTHGVTILYEKEEKNE